MTLKVEKKHCDFFKENKFQSLTLSLAYDLMVDLVELLIAFIFSIFCRKRDRERH